MSPALTEEQRAAASATSARVRILAGPGTGKTETLAARVAHLVQGTPPEGIVLLTFTQRAARAMTARLAQVLGPNLARRIRASTFHALAAQTLRAHGAALGLAPGWRIASADVQLEHMAAALEAAGPGPELPARRALELGALAINTQRPIEVVARAAGLVPPPRWIDAVFDAYAASKAAEGLLDFDDLLLLFKAFLLAPDPVAARYRAGVTHVLVDEYQDTTPLQAEIAERIGEDAHLTVVGDDAQSIYAFRGARVQNIRGFADRAPTERYTLSVSHRCPPQTLALAQALAERDRESLPRALVSAAPPGPRPALVAAAHPDQEARFVAARVRDHLAAGLPPEEIAVLYRTHAQAGPLEVELGRRGVPFAVRGRAGLFDRRIVRDALAHLVLIERPDDDAAWRRVLAPMPGIGPRRLARLRPLLAGARGPAAARVEAAAGALPGSAAAALLDLADRLRALAAAPSPAARLAQLAAPGAAARCGISSPEEAAEATGLLERLAEAAREAPDLEELLSRLALEPDLGRRPAEGAVTLATVHQAKGLEWSTVFVIGLADGVFPLARALDEPGGLDEERRLLYVAVTRARDALYLCHPERAGPGPEAPRLTPSRYLFELPEGCIERWSVE